MPLTRVDTGAIVALYLGRKQKRGARARRLRQTSCCALRQVLQGSLGRHQHLRPRARLVTRAGSRRVPCARARRPQPSPLGVCPGWREHATVRPGIPGGQQQEGRDEGRAGRAEARGSEIRRTRSPL
jgi:hypothetical protein